MNYPFLSFLILHSVSLHICCYLQTYLFGEGTDAVMFSDIYIINQEMMQFINVDMYLKLFMHPSKRFDKRSTSIAHHFQGSLFLLIHHSNHRICHSWEREKWQRQRHLPDWALRKLFLQAFKASLLNMNLHTFRWSSLTGYVYWSTYRSSHLFRSLNTDTALAAELTASDTQCRSGSLVWWNKNKA